MNNKLYYLLPILFILMLFSCVQPPTTPEAPTNLTPDGTPLRISSVNPTTFTNDKDSRVTITGTGFINSTAFFVQSTKLEIASLTRTQAIVIVPKRFLPSVYGIMVADNTGSRATLYPAFTISQAASTRAIDEEINYLSFVEGYVIDHNTQQPIQDAIVGIPGLETTTNSSGYYLLRGVPTGRQALQISSDGYEPLYRIAEVPVSSSGQTLTMKLSELEPKSTRVTMIGSNGGTHFASEDGEAGPFLKIPAGALEKDTPIQFTHLRTANTLPELPQDGYYLAFAHLGPTGLVFKKPATLFLPLQAGVEMPIGTPINISYFDAREARWVDDITNGKISEVNGKLFLEYEINHFTWIGGQWLPDPVEGRIINQNGYPLSGMTTNWGVTNATGYFKGTTTQSNVNRPINTSVILPDGTKADCPALDYSGRQAVSFPNCVVQLDRDQVPFIEPLVASLLSDTDIAPFGALSPAARPQAASDNPDAICDSELCTTTGSPIYTKPIKQVSYTIQFTNLAKVQFHTLKFFVREGEITKKVRFVKSFVDDSLKVVYTPIEPLRPDGLENPIILKGQYKNAQDTLVDFQRYQSVHSIAQFKTANIAVNILPDDFVDSNVQTPFVKIVPQGRLWVFRQSQRNPDGSVTVPINLKALDSTGQVISSLNTKNHIFFSDESAQPTAYGNPDNRNPAHARFVNGIAIIPLRVFPYNGDAKGDNINRLLLQYAAPYPKLGLPVDNAGIGARPQASVLAQPFKVLPETYSGISDSAVAAKSPSVGAKSVSFWSKVGDWFTWDNAVGVAQFGLGMVPILGGAIDCGKGVYQAVSGGDVDLVEAELGCLGMTVDALAPVIAAANAPSGVTTAIVFKPIILGLKALNNTSKVLQNGVRTALLNIIEDYFIRAGEFTLLIKRLATLKYSADLWFEGFLDGGMSRAREFARSLDELASKVMLGANCPIRSRSSLNLKSVDRCLLEVWGVFNENILSAFSKGIDGNTVLVGYDTQSSKKRALDFVNKYLTKYGDAGLDSSDARAELLKFVDGIQVPNGSPSLVTWTSPSGLKFRPENNPNARHRLRHLLDRHFWTTNPAYSNKSKFKLSDNTSETDIIDFFEDYWSKIKSGTLPPGTCLPSPNPNFPNRMECIIQHTADVGNDIRSGTDTDIFSFIYDLPDNFVTSFPGVGGP